MELINLISDIKILKISAEQDYHAERYETYPYYLKQLNAFIQCSNTYGIRDISTIDDVPFKKKGGYGTMFSEAEKVKHREIFLTAERLLNRLIEHQKLKENNDLNNPNLSDKKNITDQPINYPDKVTLSWLYKNVPFKFYITLIVIIFAAFTFGITVGQVTFIKQLLNINSSNQTIETNVINEQILSITKTHNENIKKINESIISEEKAAASSLFNDEKDKHKKAVEEFKNMITIENLRFQEEIKYFKKQFE